ncbi:hypothetical protein KT99_03929 [Shewanella benthica KT99]|uniref:Uncharacterized protein n=1 Tax=Shewanella benthica KT99 TaxID=314608 RepID=A9D1U1_9GAMM|nr:hypothetical protein KT99_03929 [Shewanella benthica KT99]
MEPVYLHYDNQSDNGLDVPKVQFHYLEMLKISAGPL